MNLFLYSKPYKTKKPIKISFEKFLSFGHEWDIPTASPNTWENIDIICKEYSGGGTLFFCFDENRESGTFYIGKLEE